MSGFPANIDVSSLNGANGFRINGAAAGDGSGYSVSSAGDVNGDGFADLIVGAQLASPNGTWSGASYVAFGKKDGFSADLKLSSLDGTNGFKISGVAEFDFSGYSVSSAGDVNGDGYDDLIAGAWGADPSGTYSGASYVVFGNKGGFGANLNLSSLDGKNGFKIGGVATRDYSGRSVSSAGDVNGDGLDDLIIGADGADPGGSGSGASYVVFGREDGFAASLSLASLDSKNGFKISGEALGDRSGRSVSSAGDINGDSFDDLIIGAPGISASAAYVVFGEAGGFAANMSLSSLDGKNGFKISGIEEDDQTGASVSSAGDINGDGYADIIVGARWADPNGEDSGASYVVFGKEDGFGADLDLSSLDGKNGFKISGVTKGDESGNSVSSAGDVNGDGFIDLLIGARYADPNGKTSSGASYVVFGKPGGFAAEFDLSSLDGNNGFKISGAAAKDQSGVSVSSAGDVNGDGFGDLIVGAHQTDPYGGGSGTSYVIFGMRAQTAVTITGTGQGLVHNGGLGDDTINGFGGRDILKGWEGNDALNGGGDNDVLRGDSGRDALTGGGGKDVLRGEAGGDDLTGGEGKDYFTYASVNQSQGKSIDEIADFTVDPVAGVAFIDRINVKAIDAMAGVDKNQAFTFIGQTGFTAEGQIRATQDGADTLVEFNTKGTGAAEMTIRLLNFTATDLTAADFVL